MNQQRQRQVEAIFLAAAACEEPGERERVIVEAAAGDGEVEAEVRSLLGGHQRDGGVLDRRPPSPLGLSLSGARQPLDFAGSLAPGARVGGYTVQRLIGAGGMGEVYIAEQERPRRQVAIKLIRSGLPGPGLLRRFEAEAEILGRLHHPGIAQVYEAGNADGRPFLVMEYIDGLPITEWAEQRGLAISQRLELMVRVCDAVQHAHQRGVIHRDIKPSNILVDAAGLPKVLDFGVARVTDADVRVTTLGTGLGQLIGTLPYMSPEQVAGDPDEVDTRSDVYALGVVLYQLLTGRLPHDLDSRSIPEAARIIRDEHPSRLSSISRTFRGDVDTIVGKALAKQKQRRYQSASELGDDVGRFLAGEPIAAKRDSVGYVLQKRLRRYRAVLGIAAAALVAVSVAGVYAGLAAMRNRRLAADLAVQLSDSRIERGRLLAQTGQASVAEEMIWAELARRPDSELARWALWDVYARSPCLASVPTFEASSFDAAYSPDGRLCAIANRLDGKVELWDRTLLRVERTLDLQSKRAFAVAISPDSKSIATGDVDGVLRIWRIDTGACVAKQDGHQGWLGSLAYVPSGEWLLSAGKDGVVHLWSADGTTPIRDLAGHTGLIYSLAVNSDSRLAASSSADRSIRIWDLASGACLQVLDDKRGGHGFDVTAVAFSPDGASLASAGLDKRLKLWSTADWKCRQTVDGLAGPPESIAFDPDGTQLYIAADGVEVRDAGDGRLLRTITPADSNRRGLTLHPSGRRLVTTSSRGRISLWETGVHPERTVIASGVGFAAGMAISADGGTLVAPGPRATVRAWEVAAIGGARRSPTEYAGPQAAVRCVTIAPDGGLIVAGAMDGTLWVWSRGTREPAKSVSAHARNVVVVAAISPDGRTVATLGTDRRARLWRLPNLEFIRDIDPRDADPDTTTAGAMLALTWSPDSARLAIGTGMTKVGVWRAADGKIEAVAKVDGPQTALAFTVDGRSLMVGTERTILRVDVGTGEVRQRLLGHAQAAIGMQVAADGTLISCGRDRTLRVWDPAGVALLTLPTGEMAPGSLSVTPDGRWAACMFDKGELAVWDLWYYRRHIAGNAEWNLNRIDPPVPMEVRERLLTEFRRDSLELEPASPEAPERSDMAPATAR